jgi:hypothetical protein
MVAYVAENMKKEVFAEKQQNRLTICPPNNTHEHAGIA